MIHRCRPVLLRFLVTSLLVLSCSHGAGRAQTQADGFVPFAGTQIFRRHVLNDLCKMIPVTSVAELDKRPTESLLIIFGELETLDQVGITRGWLRSFRDHSGAIMIASDRADNRLLEPLGVRIGGLLVHQSPQDAYLRREECPLLLKLSGHHPIFKDVHNGLATNQPSFLHSLDPSMHMLAAFPDSCWTVWAPNRAVRLAATNGYIVGSGAKSSKRVLAIAGHGVFLNEMMAQRDNDNFAFAQNCIDWLSDGGKRRRVLMVEEGRVHAKFDVPLTVKPILPIPSSSVVNKILHGLEEENFFNRLLVTLIGRDRILRIVLLFLSAGLLVFGLNRLMRARHRTERGVPPLPDGGQVGERELPVMHLRERDMVRGGNLWEAARGLARSCFDREPWLTDGAGPPQVLVAGWWRRQRLTRKVQQLWELAYGRTPIPVPPRKFARIAAAVDEVRAALASGTLRFDEPTP
jgi:hypothetical protein